MINVNGVQLMTKSDFLNLFVTIGDHQVRYLVYCWRLVCYSERSSILMFIPVPIKAKYFVYFMVC